MQDGKSYRTPDRPGRARRTHLEVRLSLAMTGGVFTKAIADLANVAQEVHIARELHEGDDQGPWGNV